MPLAIISTPPDTCSLLLKPTLGMGSVMLQPQPLDTYNGTDLVLPLTLPALGHETLWTIFGVSAAARSG